MGVSNGTNNSGANGYVASLSAGFSLKAVELAMGGCWFGREHVDMLVSDQNSWNWFFNKLQPMQRFNEESSDVAKSGLMASPAAAKSADEQSSLIKLNPETGTDCKQVMSRAAVTTEREDTLRGDATVCSHANVKHETVAEMTTAAESASNNKVRSFQFVGAQVVVDQYAPSGNMYGINSKSENLAFYSSTLKRYQFGSKAPLQKTESEEMPIAA